jgi:hypothetical protein
MSERWKPKHGELYYYISTTGVVTTEKFNECDAGKTNRCLCGNCFRTAVEAESAAEKFKAFLLSLHEPVTDCNQLPKLTAEVFNRPDCPEWAKYAAVSKFGCLTFFEKKPVLGNNSFLPSSDYKITLYRNEPGRWDASDWQNSLIERPAQLPDWCEVGKLVYYKVLKKYCRIVEISDCIITIKSFDGGRHGNKIVNIQNYILQASVRPWTVEEAPFNIKVQLPAGKRHLLKLHIEDSGNFFYRDESCHDMRAAEVADTYFQLDGSPCGRLEHLENGEWVN